MYASTGQHDLEAGFVFRRFGEDGIVEGGDVNGVRSEVVTRLPEQLGLKWQSTVLPDAQVPHLTAVYHKMFLCRVFTPIHSAEVCL